MGVSQYINYENYPKQNRLNRRVNVCYEYNPDLIHTGKIIRDDIEGDYLTIIQLDNGRVLLASECQYAFVD